MSGFVRLIRGVLPGLCLLAASPAALAQDWLDIVVEDYQAHYHADSLLQRGALVGIGAAFANSEADDEARDRIRRARGGVEFSRRANRLGDAMQLGRIMPLYLGAMLLGAGAESGTALGAVSGWGARSMRSLAVGLPEFLMLAKVTGAQRPAEGEADWEPFADDNGVSGHAFFGAVPLLTAAHMTRQPVLHYGLVAGSILPGFARLGLDKHYLSQVLMGWGLAYFSVRTVARGGPELGPFEIDFRVLEGGGGAIFIQSGW